MTIEGRCKVVKIWAADEDRYNETQPGDRVQVGIANILYASDFHAQ